MSFKSCIAVAATVGGVLFPLPCAASSFATGLGASFTSCAQVLNSPIPITASTTCNESQDYGTIFTTNATLRSRADLMSLGAYVDYSLQFDSPSGFSTNGGGAYAYATANDVLTITGGSGNGILHVGFTVSGIGAAQYPFDVVVQLVVAGGLGAPTYFYGSGSYALDVPFTYGSPLSLYRQLDVGISVSSRAPFGYWGSGPGQGGPLGGLVDYYHSANLNLTVLDDQMRPVSGATVTSDTGFVYPSTGTVPEPTMILLVMPALLLLLRATRRTAGG